MTKPIFIAHRGYASSYPENTLVALDAAKQAGAEYIEVDIQLTSDGIPVLFHDRDLKRLCQQNGSIHDYTFSQLEKFNVTDAEKFGTRFSENKITSLEKFIAYIKKHPGLNVFIELKRLMIDKAGEEKTLAILLPMFYGMEKKIIFISYNQTILKNIHDNTNFKTGIVVDEWSQLIKSNWLSDWVFCSADGLPENNNELDIDAKIAVFEVGNIGLAKHLLAKGIVYLETFRIREMLTAFACEM